LARAQQPTPVIGFLSSRSPNESEHVVAAFRQGLEESGYLEGQNVHISFRWAEGGYAQLPELAAELVHAHVAVIASVGGPISALAAKQATATIPIVAVSSEPVKHGLVASFNRPGGNVTAVSPGSTVLSAKRLGLLHDLIPRAALIGHLVNPNSPDRDVQFVSSDPFFDTRRDQIVALAAHHAIPTMYAQRPYVAAGGLMSYSPSFAEAYRQAGIYAARILKGAKPADLPVVQSSKFELVINMKTAKALGIEVPNSMQLLADEVIE
jgi:putative ABC transport system substrate-binding protein